MRDVDRPLHLYGPAFALHDVRDVEAHVRRLLDSTLDGWGAHLDAAKYDDALTYLVSLCWRLSGLQGDGRTPRVVHVAHISISDRGLTWTLALGPFTTRDAAEASAMEWKAQARQGPLIVIEYREQRPPGAYDPSFGISFSTYSRRILSRRLVDWYRESMGDTRYSGRGRRELSLEHLADEWASSGEGGDESYLDRLGPGGRLHIVDELNRHIYTDQVEEALTRVALPG